MTSSLVFLSTCFFRKRRNSPWRSTFWSRLSRAFSASVTMMNAARAIFSLPRRGRRGFNGSFSLTWLTPASAGAARRIARTPAHATRIETARLLGARPGNCLSGPGRGAREAAALAMGCGAPVAARRAGSGERSRPHPAESLAGASAGRRSRPSASDVLGRTGGFPRRAGIGRVELGEAGVIAVDVGVFRVELERLLVLLQRAGELARRLQRHGEVVVGPRVGRLLGDGLLEAESGLAPESLVGDFRAERDLGLGAFRLRVGGAARRDQEKGRDRRCPTHSHAPVPPAGDRYYRKAFGGLEDFRGITLS